MEMEARDLADREVIKVEANGDEKSEVIGIVPPLLVAMQPNGDEEVQETIEPIEVVVLSGAHDDMNSVEIQSTADAACGSVVALGAVEEVIGENADSIPFESDSFMSEIRVKSERPNRYRQKTSKYGKPKSEWILPSAFGTRSTEHQPNPEKDSSSEDSSSDESSTNEDDGSIPSHIAARKMPKKREFAHRLQWRNKDMAEALKSVQDNKLSIRGASRKYKVPYSTLKDRVHGRVRHGTKPGVKTALSPEEENDLVTYVQDLEQAGFQFRCVDVRVRAAEILRLNYGHNSPYKDTSPGHNWLSGFLKRHPGLEFKKSMTRNIIPSVPKQKMIIRRFYDTITYFYKKNKVTGRAERIFTVSEMKVPIYNEASILYSASADGTVMSPFVVFTGPAQKRNLNVARQAYPDASFTCTIEGQITEDVFLWWFRDHFLPKITHVHKPVVLLISRPVNDLSFQLVQLAKEERVFLLAIPNLVAHLLQPLDSAFSSEVEAQIMRRVMKWEGENPQVACTHKVLAQILQKVWKKTICGVDVRSKFKEKGIYPVNSSIITSEQIQFATQKLKEEPQQRSPGVARASSINSSSGPFQGLNLLSALSSHEYASLDNTPEKENPMDDADYYEPDEDGAHRGEGEQERIILRVSRKKKKVPTATLR